MWPRFPFKEQALRASVWVFVVGTRLHRAAAVAPSHFSSTAVEQEPKREQRKGFCFSCDIWGQLLPYAGSGERKAKIRAEATHWSSWLYLGMCKLVDGFSDQFLPQAECSHYELQHLPFHFFFFFSNGARKKKKVLFFQRKYWIMSSTFILFTPILLCRISSLQQPFPTLAAVHCYRHVSAPQRTTTRKGQ